MACKNFTVEIPYAVGQTPFKGAVDARISEANPGAIVEAHGAYHKNSTTWGGRFDEIDVWPDSSFWIKVDSIPEHPACELLSFLPAWGGIVAGYTAERDLMTLYGPGFALNSGPSTIASTRIRLERPRSPSG
ncbi:MAG TPA: hypothetical protein VKF41_08885 [Bryobacteraceae bacterium]|nr:hypothetical protein [Bryobacteraceae bacterium]